MLKTTPYILVILILSLSLCCVKKSNYTLPVVMSIYAKPINISTIEFSGNVKSDGGHPIIERGVIGCICGNIIDTTRGYTKTLSGTGTGVFMVTVNNLSNNSDYYWRAYAKNILGTSYGDVIFAPTP